MERIEERYLRWLLEVDSRTPGYIVKEDICKGGITERKAKGKGRNESLGF